MHTPFFMFCVPASRSFHQDWMVQILNPILIFSLFKSEKSNLNYGLSIHLKLQMLYMFGFTFGETKIDFDILDCFSVELLILPPKLI